MRVIESRFRDAAHNLALEEVLFDSLAEEEGLLLLYCNRPAVVVGKYQNAWEEVSPEAIRAGLPVLRRMSGGGAVYHDPGNLNYSLITHVPSRRMPDVHTRVGPVLRALSRLGCADLSAESNGLSVGGVKVSGHAQRMSRGRLLHHGTLLVHTDLAALRAALRPPADTAIESKAVKSIRSPVANLSERLSIPVSIEQLRDAITEQMQRDGKAPIRRGVTADEAARVERLVVEKYCTWEWNFGGSPPFTMHKTGTCGGLPVSLKLDVRHGRIEHCRLNDDLPLPIPSAHLESRLEGVAFREADIREALVGAAGTDDPADAAWRELLALLLP